MPSSACFNTKAICASKNFELFVIHSAALPSFITEIFTLKAVRKTGSTSTTFSLKASL